MDLRQIQLFDLLAEHCHYGRAATEAGIAQPALSQHILHLEHEVRCRLFERTASGAQVTGAGALLRDSARKTLAAVADLHSAAAGLRRSAAGVVRLGIPLEAQSGVVSTFVDALIARGFAVETETRFLTEEADAVRRRAVDAALIHLPAEVDGLRVTEPLAAVPLAVLLPVDDPHASLPSIGLADVVNREVVPLAGRPASAGEAVLTDEYRTAGLVTREDAERVRSYEQLLDAVAAGVGVAFAPAGLEQLMVRRDVAYVPLRDCDPARLVFAWHPDQHHLALGQLVTVARQLAASAMPGEGMDRAPVLAEVCAS